MFIEGDLGAHGRAPARHLAGPRARGGRHRRRTDPRSPRQITSGVVYRFLHRPVSAPRVRLFVDAALRRHEVENVERTLEQTRPDFSRLEAAKAKSSAGQHAARAMPGIVAARGRRGRRRRLVRDVVRRDSGRATARHRGAVVSAPAEAPRPKPGGRRAAPPAARKKRRAAAPQPAPVRPSPRRRRRPLRRRPRRIRARAPAPRGSVAGRRAGARRGRAAHAAARPRPPTNNACASNSRRPKPPCSAASSPRRRDETPWTLFRGALELDPGNTLAKAGLVRVADRLLSAAERALTGGQRRRRAEDGGRRRDRSRPPPRVAPSS